MRVLFCKGQTMGSISGADELIVTYATRLRASMGRAGRARYEATSSPPAVFPLLLETYQRLRAECVPLPCRPAVTLAPETSV